jgi:hypothetical protein
MFKLPYLSLPPSNAQPASPHLHQPLGILVLGRDEDGVWEAGETGLTTNGF